MGENDTFNPYEKWLGIPPDEQPADYYRLLVIERFESDIATIARAADARMVHIRTFQTGPRGALTQKLLNEISAARICLTDDESRDQYDRQLRGEPVEVNVDVAPPTPTVDPMAPMGTVTSVDPMAPLAIPGVPQAIPTLGAMDPMAPLGAPSPSPHFPAPIATPGAARVQVSPLIPQGGITASSQRRRKKSSPVAKLLMTVMAIGIVAGLVWGIGKAIKINNERANGGSSQDGGRANDGDDGDGNADATGEDDGDVFTSDSTTLVSQETDGGINLTPVTAKLVGDGLVMRSDGLDSIVSNWTSEEQWVEWQFNIVRTGLFQIELTYASTSTGEIIIEVGGERKQLDLRDSKGEKRFIIDQIQVRIDKPGDHTLIIRPASIQGSQLMRLKSVRMTPRDLK